MPHGITKSPTRKSAKAKDTMSQLVDVCRLFSMMTLPMTRRLPKTAKTGRMEKATKTQLYSSISRSTRVVVLLELSISGCLGFV